MEAAALPLVYLLVRQRAGMTPRIAPLFQASAGLPSTSSNGYGYCSPFLLEPIHLIHNNTQGVQMLSRDDGDLQAWVRPRR